MYAKIKNIFSCVFTAFAVIVNFYYIALMVRFVYATGHSGAYLYFTVKPNLIVYTLCLFLCLIPSILAAVLLWRAIVSDGMLLPLLLWALIPITWAYLHFGMFPNTGKLTFTSRTEDPQHYLQVDARIADGYTGCYEDFFPEAIPEEAEDVYYVNQYRVSQSGSLMRIEVSFILPKEAYETAKSFGRAQNGTETIKDGTADRWFYYDDERQRVIYRVQLAIPGTQA